MAAERIFVRLEDRVCSSFSDNAECAVGAVAGVGSGMLRANLQSPPGLRPLVCYRQHDTGPVVDLFALLACTYFESARRVLENQVRRCWIAESCRVPPAPPAVCRSFRIPVADRHYRPDQTNPASIQNEAFVPASGDGMPPAESVPAYMVRQVSSALLHSV